MASLSRCSRAWLSFLLLQDLGVIWMCCSGKASLLFKTATPLVTRQYSIAVALICIVRIFLLGFFESGPLHVCHISVTTLYALSMCSEIFYYESIDSSAPNIARVIVQVVTAILFTIAQRWLYALPQAEPARRKGRLFAKHYMEGNLLNPPESDDVRELRKKQI